MKILQLTNKVPWPPKDGGAIATLTLSKGFRLLGHQVTVLAMNTLKHYINLNEIPDKIRQDLNFHLADVPARINKWEMMCNLLFSKLPYNAVRFYDEDFGKLLIQHLKENQYDIIQLEGLYLCPYISLLRKHSKALISYRAHNIEFEIWERTSIMSSGLKKIYLKILSTRLKKFEQSFLNEYDVLVPITHRDGAMLDKMGNNKPSLSIQTGIDLSNLVPKAKNLEYPSIFHIGALDWSPNQEGLLWFIDNCWPRLSKLHPELKFYIAGRNAPEWLEKKLIAPGIHYLGEIEDAYEFMNSKAIMIVPLHTGSGMRIKIVEGMALGKAIVSTPIGTEGIDTTNNENILIASEPETFIAQVSRLVEDRPLFDKLCKNSVNFIHKNFDNLSITNSLIEFYKEHMHE